MLYIYTGNGKGKTTAAMGQALRALGRGYRVCIIQLFKGKVFHGEQKILKKLKNMSFYSFAPKHPLCFKAINLQTVKKQCAKAMEFAFSVLRSKKHDIIILEEFNIALRDGYIDKKALINAVSKAAKSKDIVITGRGAPKVLIKAADLVTEMKEIKHPYKKGIKARKGIEF